MLRYHFPDSEFYDDITKTDFKKWRGQIDVLSAGFPCQPFSVAGKRAGVQDNRYLWTSVLRVITEIEPRWILCENVAGLCSMVLPGQEITLGSSTDLFGENHLYKRIAEEYILEKICGDFEAVGYDVQTFIIPACSVGAPHRRDRLWFLACRREPGKGEIHSRPVTNPVNFRFKGRDSMGGERKTCNERCRNTEEGRTERSEVDNRTRQNDDFTSNSLCRRSDEICSDLQSQESDGEGINGFGKKRSATNTNLNFGQQGRMYPDESTEARMLALMCHTCSTEGFWKEFPTESALCGGDDGLPKELLTIPFSQWRRAAIKALGNSVVPQVVLEIYKAIELTDSLFFT